MRKICTLSAALICGLYTQAQQASKPVNPLQRGFKAAPQTTEPGKVTSNDSRPIAITNLDWGASAFELRDSTIAFYTGNNGYDYATDDWKYDSSRTWNFNASTSQWEDNGRSYQVITGNRIMSTLFRQWSGSQWEDDSKESYTYTNGYIATDILQSNSGSGLENEKRTTNTFNSDNKIIETVDEQWNTTSNQWEKSHRMTFHFNSNKLVDTTTEYVWNSSTAQWQANSRNLNTYTNGLLTGTLQQNYMGGTWNDNTRSTYTYDTKGNQTSMEYEEWDNVSQSWRKIYKETHDYNSMNDKITDIHMSTMGGSSYINTNKTLYTYDQNHRPLTEESQTWDGTASQWTHTQGTDYLTRYYYEPYTNGVKDLGRKDDMSLSVYPVPAADRLNIELGVKNAQAVSIAIFDMSGTLVQHWTDQASMQYHKTLDVSGIPAGSYMIRVLGNAGQSVKTISIAH